MNSNLSTYAITPVELKGVRCKISKVNEGKSRQRTSFFGWRKCSDASTVSDDEGSEDSYPSMRAVVWCQQDESSTGVAAESILSCPMKVVSTDEYGEMNMNCLWPDGSKLYVSNVSNEEQVTLRLGIQVQNEALLSIGTARVSSTGCGSTFLIFLPIEQSDQVGNERYEFDVSSSRLSTVMDIMTDANLGNFFVNQSMTFLTPNAGSNVALISNNGTTTSEYVEDNWKLWETDDVVNNKFDDFSFEPVFEDVPAASLEQGEQGNLVEAGVEDESKPKDCFDDSLRPRCLSGKGGQSDVDEESIDYPTSLIEFKGETGEINQVEFTDDAAPKKAAFTKNLDRLLKRQPRENNATSGKSTCTVTTASTCSSTSSDITPEREAFYMVCSDNTAEEDVSRGCCSTFAEIIDIISRRDCVQRNFELCLEELLDDDDDNSFLSEANYSVKSKRGNRKFVRVRRSYLVKEDKFMKKKKRFTSNKKAVEL